MNGNGTGDKDLSYTDLMGKLGACMDRMKGRHFNENDAGFCAKIANVMYLLMLNISEIKISGASPFEEIAAASFQDCAYHLNYAMDCYLKSPECNVLDGIIAGMRALRSYHMAKRVLNQVLKSIQADNESSTSQSDTSQS